MKNLLSHRQLESDSISDFGINTLKYIQYAFYNATDRKSVCVIRKMPISYDRLDTKLFQKDFFRLSLRVCNCFSFSGAFSNLYFHILSCLLIYLFYLNMRRKSKLFKIKDNMFFFFWHLFFIQKKKNIFLDINKYNFSLFLFFSRDGDPVQLLFVKPGVKKKKKVALKIYALLIKFCRLPTITILFPPEIISQFFSRLYFSKCCPRHPFILLCLF